MHTTIAHGLQEHKEAAPLAEAPCSVNIRFKVRGFLDAAQATGRGHTPDEAAENLRRTIEATRAALAGPPALAGRTTRLALLLDSGTEKALACGDRKLVERLVNAYLLVLDGKVADKTGKGSPLPRYQVHSQQEPAHTIYEVCEYGCTCRDSKNHAADEIRYACKHVLSVLYYQRLLEQEEEACHGSVAANPSQASTANTPAHLGTSR